MQNVNFTGRAWPSLKKVEKVWSTLTLLVIQAMNYEYVKDLGDDFKSRPRLTQVI